MTGTFNETYFEFNQEVQLLGERIAELEAEADELDDGDDRRQEINAKMQMLKSQRKGAIWARDQAREDDDFPAWDGDVDGVTLGALRAGPYAGLVDDVESDPDAGSGTTASLLVAEATVEAPYLDDDMSSKKRAAAVASLHPYYRDWAEGRINDLLDPEAGNG